MEASFYFIITVFRDTEKLMVTVIPSPADRAMGAGQWERRGHPLSADANLQHTVFGGDERCLTSCFLNVVIPLELWEHTVSLFKMKTHSSQRLY